MKRSHSLEDLLKLVNENFPSATKELDRRKSEVAYYRAETEWFFNELAEMVPKVCLLVRRRDITPSQATDFLLGWMEETKPSLDGRADA